MSLKSRLLRILLALTAVLGFAGYFAFSTFLFNPLEGDYESDISTLVPRKVDFFVAKARLAQDFAPFPHLAAEQELAASRAWRSLSTSPGWLEFEHEQQLDKRLAELEQALGQLRGVDPLSAFGGRDLALAGRFKGPTAGDLDWALYGRASWTGKLGASALSYPGLLGLEANGLSVAVEDDHVALSGAGLQQELFVTRVRDVVVVGNSRELVLAALELDARAGQDSFGQSADYFDTIQNAKRGPVRDEIEMFLDWRALSEKARLSGRWPAEDSPEYLTRLAARFFQLGAIKDASGVLGFDRGLSAHLQANLSSEMISGLQARLYRKRGTDKREILREAAALAPEDTGLFLYFEIGVGDLLRELLAASEPALRSNLDDVLRSTGVYTGAESLITELDELFRSGVALIVRENDYRVVLEKDPPNDGQPTYAVSLVLWTDGSSKARGKLDELQKLIVRNQQSLGLVGPRAGDPGVFYNEVNSGHTIWEFWSRMITGTGHLATVVDDKRFVISNSFRMLEDLIGTFYRRQGSRPGLPENFEFKALASEGLPQANLMLWYAPERMGPTARKLADTRARNEVLGSLDLARERVREEALILRQEFNGLTLGQLGPDEKRRLDESVDARMDELQKRRLSEGIPTLRQGYERQQDYQEFFSSMLVMLALDPKRLELTAGALRAQEEP